MGIRDPLVAHFSNFKYQKLSNYQKQDKQVTNATDKCLIMDKIKWPVS